MDDGRGTPLGIRSGHGSENDTPGRGCDVSTWDTRRPTNELPVQRVPQPVDASPAVPAPMALLAWVLDRLRRLPR